MRTGCALLSLLLGGVGAAPAQEPVVWLPFDEVVEGGFACRVPQAAVCRVTGTPRPQHGGVVISHLDALALPELDLSGAVEQLTVSAWVAPSERPAEYQSILYKGRRNGPDDQRIHLYLALFNGRPEFKFQDAAGRWQGIMRNAEVMLQPGGENLPLAQVPAVPAAAWSHLAATFDRGQVRVYLNGQPLLAGRTTVDRLAANPDPLRLGEAQDQNGARGYVFRGLIDEVRIYDRALDAAAVAALHAAERPAKATGKLTIDRPLPAGYDPEFKVRLPLVAAYQQNPPPAGDFTRPLTAEVRPHGGATTLFLNGEPISTVAMMPEPYAANDEITLSCRDFAAARVDVVSEIFWTWMKTRAGCDSWWLGPGQYDFAKIDARIRAILAANPNARLLPRLKLNPPQWWLAQHPDEITREADGKLAPQASLASAAWEATYERMLRDVIRHLEASDYANHIIGYHPAGGSSSEWFWWGANGRTDFSPAAITRYRQWLRERYRTDAALQAAWGDPAARCDTAVPPSPEARLVTHHGLFRDPVKGRPVADYLTFLSDLVSSNIVRSCRIVKEETQRRKLAGVFYGYSLYCVNQDGFRGLERVLNSPEVDFLAAPTSYERRRGGDAGCHISGYTASYRLHDKLYWDEVDTRTHLYPGYESYRVDDLTETLEVHRRAVGNALTRGTGLWWFLLAGNATFHHAAIMDDIARLKQTCDAALTADRTPTSEVAVFADEAGLNGLHADHRVLTALLRDSLEATAHVGAPCDIYHLSDITSPALPDYRLYVFLNAFTLSDEQRRSITAKVRRAGRTAAWVYAPGYVTPTGFSAAATSALTGLAVTADPAPQPCELTVTGPAHPLTADLPPRREANWQLAPSFTVTDPDATILGTTAGRPSLAVRELPAGQVVYSALPLTTELLRGICRYAGVHVYTTGGDPFFANTSYVLLHAAGDGPKRVTLPAERGVTDLLANRDLGRLTVIDDTLRHGETRLWQLRP